MKFTQTIQIVKDVCALRHLSFKTEKTYLHWIGRYASFLKENPNQRLSSEKKMEAFLTRLAFTGLSGASQNQAFHALLFLDREVLKRELGPATALPMSACAGNRNVATKYRPPTRSISREQYRLEVESWIRTAIL